MTFKIKQVLPTVPGQVNDRQQLVVGFLLELELAIVKHPSDATSNHFPRSSCDPAGRDPNTWKVPKNGWQHVGSQKTVNDRQQLVVVFSLKLTNISKTISLRSKPLMLRSIKFNWLCFFAPSIAKHLSGQAANPFSPVIVQTDRTSGHPQRKGD